MNVSSAPLVPAVKQQSHKETLTVAQLEEAKLMGVKGLTVKNTQYDLLKLVKFQKERARITNKFVKNLRKKHGSKKARILLIKKENEQNRTT